MTSSQPSIFSEPLTLEDGIYRALNKRPRVPLAQSSNFLPLTAAFYEPLWRKRSVSIITGGDFDVERELALMLKWTNPQPGQVVLDAACSAGLYARTLLEHEDDLEVHAVDFSLPFLKKAKEYAVRDEVQLHLIQADVKQLPLKDSSFDLIVCGASLNEFTDLPQSITELGRVLKPGGLMWQMYVSKAEAWTGRIFQSLFRLSGIRFVDPVVLESQAQAVGMRLRRAQHRGRVSVAIFEKL